MRTSSRDVMKTLGRSTAALVCVLSLASCTSGDSEAEAANPCGISASSEEEALVRGILATEDFETKAYKSTSALVDKTKWAVQRMRPGKDSYFNAACRYEMDDRQRGAYAIFSFGWSPRATSDVPVSPSSASYAWNGAGGVASDSGATLLVQCDLPGELGAQSRNVRLSADAMFSFRPSRPVADQATKDQRMTLTYLMTRRVTEALGCENKPLAKAPVVKPLSTP
ncbi:hypothetical protein [Streptomyces sp. WM4235]|uniref:hypothetical protein n=1 Tax=Streptomyces sp. WM4235 TaxID=1415551 RepID=UPI00131D117F|nr:hypothetical protein [Streptomyces sp. WM4235]